ncbi:hypothetical protein CF319_g750 [Tilletia indica]|nr:hypothetical protein CF319_g750 [Tilletia indica]
MAEHVDYAAMAAAHMFGVHGGMGHGGMDHGGMDHGGMHEPAACKMGMLMSYDWPLDRCVVLSSWHPRTNTHVFLTLLALIALSAAFEYLRWRIRAIDTFLALELASRGSGLHTRKASLASGSLNTGLMNNNNASSSSGLSAPSSITDRRPSSSRSGSPSHTALNMSSADDPYADDVPRRNSQADGQEDDARAKAQRTRTAGSASASGPKSVVQAFFCSPRTLRVSTRIQLVRVLLYGLNVAAGAFLMLVLMTYNTWHLQMKARICHADLVFFVPSHLSHLPNSNSIGATVFGAMVGHFFFSRELGLVPQSTRHQQPGQASFVAIPGIDVDKGLSCH